MWNVYTIETLTDETDPTVTAELWQDGDAENPRVWCDGLPTVIIGWPQATRYARNYPMAVDTDMSYRDPVTGGTHDVNVENFANPTGYDYDPGNYDPVEDGDPALAALHAWIRDVTDLFGADAWIAWIRNNDGAPRRDSDPIALADTNAIAAALARDLCVAWSDALAASTPGQWPNPDEYTPPVERAHGMIVTSARTCSVGGQVPPTDAATAAAYIDADLRELHAWCRGNVYGYTVSGGNEYGDSCGGFYDYDEAQSEAVAHMACARQYRADVAAWIRAAAEWQLTVPDVPTMLTGYATLSALTD